MVLKQEATEKSPVAFFTMLDPRLREDDTTGQGLCEYYPNCPGSTFFSFGGNCLSNSSAAASFTK